MFKLIKVIAMNFNAWHVPRRPGQVAKERVECSSNTSLGHPIGEHWGQKLEKARHGSGEAEKSISMDCQTAEAAHQARWGKVCTCKASIIGVLSSQMSTECCSKKRWGHAVGKHEAVPAFAKFQVNDSLLKLTSLSMKQPVLAVYWMRRELNRICKSMHSVLIRTTTRQLHWNWLCLFQRTPKASRDVDQCKQRTASQ